MREYYQVVAYDQDGDSEVIDTFTSLEEAEQCLFRCQEGDDKHDPCFYDIESTSVAE
jgi:hypothetical protein